MDHTSNNATSLPYLGNRISLISNAEIRYEGILYSINTCESTVALQNVRSFGTEGRRQPEVPPNNRTYQFIIFKGKDIKDLTVCEPAAAGMPDDPAIVTVNVQPAAAGGSYGPPNRSGNSPGSHPNYPNQGPMNQMNHMPPRGGGGYYGGPPNRMYNNQSMYGYHDNDQSYYAPRGERGGPTRGGMNRNSAGRAAPRRVVGELPPQPNQAIKKEVSKAFDFESSNAKFDKSEGTRTTKEEPEEGAEPKETITLAVRGYDKTTSFFDRISCDALDRRDGKEPRMDREKQRQLDCTTFGATANLPRGLRPRRNFMRGGPRRGYGGSYGQHAERPRA